MAGYIDPPLETDPEALAADAIDYLTANVPGFVPQEGHLEIWWIESFARMVAEARDVASRVPRSIFRFFGQILMALPPIDATPARAASTWTMIDDAGYTIEAGTLVGFEVAGDDTVVFSVDADVVVAPGDTVTNAGGVLLSAVEYGAAANGIAAGPMVPVDDVFFASSIVSTSPVTAGGTDAETDDAYLSRLREELQIGSPEPILPVDFAILAKRVAGVTRAVSIDGYDPGDDTDGNARTISLALVDADGQAVAAGVKTDVSDLLESMREINWDVFVIDPEYTDIDVTFTFTVVDGWDPVDVKARAEAAVSAYLDPANWGGGDETPPVWNNETTVRYLEIASIINNVAGVDSITTTAGNFNLLVEGARVDVALSGRAPLTNPGTITGTAA